MGTLGSLTQLPKRLNRRLGPKGMKVKNHNWSIYLTTLTVLSDFVAMVGEFIGTTMFLFFAFAGTQIANLNNANPTPQTSNESTTSTVTRPILCSSLSHSGSLSWSMCGSSFESLAVCSTPRSPWPWHSSESYHHSERHCSYSHKSLAESRLLRW